MLSSNLQTLLDNRLRYLPDITAQAIASVDWPIKVIEIGRKFGLHMEDIEDLQAVVLKSMTGLASPDDFETNIIAATAASPATVNNIIQELNRQIFEPIHDFVMSGGKAPDPLAQHGIALSSEDDVPVSTPMSSVAPKPAVRPTTEEPSELIIPSSPGKIADKPVIDSFSAFFARGVEERHVPDSSVIQ